MDKRIVLVTGATGNLGEAVIKKFLAEGCVVTGTVTKNGDQKKIITDTNFEAIEADLTNEESAQEVVKTIIARQKRIDAAILTVGGFALGAIADTKAGDILQQYTLNFETAYNIARPVFLQMMQQKYGRIFLIGSRPGLDAKNSAGMVAYGLAKSLLFRLAELMNEEANKTNVVTSVIVPGTIDTPQNRKAMPNAQTENWVTPEAIADIISFYCSDKASTLREPVIKVYNKG